MVEMPAVIGRYAVVRELGAGGMGQVYLAHSPAGDPVAVKVMRADRLDPVTRARFEREAQAARTVVTTSRVARFLDADPFAERPWLAMEFIPGRTLDEYVGAYGTVEAPLVASLGALLAEGLSAVHEAGLLHRDLKPQNVILGEYGPVIIDFGLAAFADAHTSLTHSGTIIGTVRCMPPEQAAGRPHVTPAADVYALGTVLLFAATGHYPYEAPAWDAVVRQIVNEDHAPDLTGLPDPLVPVVRAMLAHAPEDRPSLDAVTAMCATLLAEQGWTAVRARHALVERTAGASLRDTVVVMPHAEPPVGITSVANRPHPDLTVPLAWADLPGALDVGPDWVREQAGTLATTQATAATTQARQVRQARQATQATRPPGTPPASAPTAVPESPTPGTPRAQPPAAAPADAASAHAPESAVSPSARRPARPASTRIAEDLRAAYAPGGVL